MSGQSLLGRASLWAPPIAYMAMIFFFSAEPDPLPKITEAFWDKTLHFVGYAGLAFLFCRAFAGERFALSLALLSAFVATSAYGASDEWHQSFVPGRSPEVQDWLADTVGAGLGLIAYGIWISTVSRLPRQPRR
jgi:VanZ family protein